MDKLQEARMGAATKENWSVASAKARFSEVMEKAKTDGPQTVTRNGRPAAVVVSIEEWERRTVRKGTLGEFFMNSPLRGSGIDLTRDDQPPRDIDLS
jgi:prevent-host-death family protein